MSSILIVDENSDAFDLYGQLLSEEGHEPFPARDASEAVKELSVRCPDLVILNLELPEAVGRRLFATFRALPRRPAIVTMLAYTEWSASKMVRAGLHSTRDTVDLLSMVNGLIASTSYWPRS